MTKPQTNDLKIAVEDLHGCTAIFAREIEIAERFNNSVAWEGTVSQFEIIDHPDSDTCYAWSEPIKGSNKRRFFAVLKVPPVDSPESAVRASIMADYKAAQHS